MKNLLHFVLRLLLALVALLTGCAAAKTYNVYGMPVPAHDPSVVVTDFSYTPAGPVSVGDTLTFRAVLNKPAALEAALIGIFQGDADADAGSEATLSLNCLNDAGIPPDEQALDGIWTGEYTWPASAGTGDSLPVFARLLWMDGYLTEPVDAAALTVMPEDEAE